jgi:enoyl-CoA hydratase/carnithine racemase
MDGSLIEVDWLGAVALVRWEDGENRFRADSVARWHEVLDELESVDGPLAVVVTGAGKFFSNGLDLDWVAAHPDDGAAMVDSVHRLLGRMLVFPAFVAGAINGHAFAAGAMLSATFDTRVMRGDRGYWCLPEVDLGLPLTDAMMAAVTARLPAPAAADAAITGRRYSGPEAKAIGIVSHVASEHHVVSSAIDLAAAMVDKDRSVIATHKRMLVGDAATRCGWVRATG